MMTDGPHIGPLVTLDAPAFIHPTAQLYGKVHVGRDASIWPYAVFRAEMYEIVIGEESNIQDFVMVHVGAFTPTIVGKRCSITHHVTLHGCTIGDDCLIGIGATLMDGSVIGAGSIVAGHAIVTENSVFPDHSIIAGSPARLVKTRDSSVANRRNAMFYKANGHHYARGEDRMDPAELAAIFAPEG